MMEEKKEELTKGRGQEVSREFLQIPWEKVMLKIKWENIGKVRTWPKKAKQRESLQVHQFPH